MNPFSSGLILVFFSPDRAAGKVAVARGGIGV